MVEPVPDKPQIPNTPTSAGVRQRLPLRTSGHIRTPEPATSVYPNRRPVPTPPVAEVKPPITEAKPPITQVKPSGTEAKPPGTILLPSGTEQSPPVKKDNPEKLGFIEDVKKLWPEYGLGAPFKAISHKLVGDANKPMSEKGAIGWIRAILAFPMEFIASTLQFISGLGEHTPQEAKELFSKINPKTDFEKAKTGLETATKTHEDLKQQVKTLSEEVAAKQKMVAEIAPASNTAHSGPAPDDKKALETATKHEKSAQEAKALADQLKTKQAELNTARKKMEQAQSELDKATKNISEEIARREKNAEKTDKKVEETMAKAKKDTAEQKA